MVYVPVLRLREILHLNTSSLSLNSSHVQITSYLLLSQNMFSDNQGRQSEFESAGANSKVRGLEA